MPYILQSLLRLDLHNSHQRVVRLLQILRRRLSAELLHRKRRSEPPLSDRREFRGLDQLPRVVGSIEKRHDDAMGASVEGSCMSKSSAMRGAPQAITDQRSSSMACLRLTIHPSLAGIRTTGLTPQAAMAATASCIAASICTLGGIDLTQSGGLGEAKWIALYRQYSHVQCLHISSRSRILPSRARGCCPGASAMPQT